MRTNRDYPFPLPIITNKDEFLDAVRDVATAVKDRNGDVKDYREDTLPGGGNSGNIVVEEDV